MAAVTPSADQTTDLMENLSLDSQSKTHDAADATQKPSSVQPGSTDGQEEPNTSTPSREQSVTPLLQEATNPSLYYLPNGYPSPAYYYGGYDGSGNVWGDYTRYMNHDGVRMTPGAYGGDVYHTYEYAPYSVFSSSNSSVPTAGHDSQHYGPQHYQYPSPYYQTLQPPSAAYTLNNVPNSQGEVSSTAATNHPPYSVDTAKATSNGTAKAATNGTSELHAYGGSGTVQLRSSHQSPLLTSYGVYGRGAVAGRFPTSTYQDPRYSFDGRSSPVPWYYGSVFSAGQHRGSTTGSISSASLRNQNQRPLSHLTGLHSTRPTPVTGPAAHGFLSKMYPNNRTNDRFGTSLRTGLGLGSNGYDSRINGRWSLVMDSKYKPRGRGSGFYSYANESLDGLIELNRGPRAGHIKNVNAIGPNVTIAVKGQNLSSIVKEDSSVIIPDREQYNHTNFPEKYSNAKFFIIKSYSEDDIHKSIKYNVWASTPNGNKKLDAGYLGAQQSAAGCPVFLLFSVNTSGQFVGIAEMVGPVDFNKTVDCWHQDKWYGCFPVKWHIIKDVPNSILRNIILENNDNKPVTNSRDTQEVELQQGLQLLKIFKEHVSKTSILDDFGFYNTREKLMQENRAKQQQFEKQATDAVDDESDKNGANGNPMTQKPLESVSAFNNEAAPSGYGEQKLSTSENGVRGEVADEVLKLEEPASEQLTAVSVVANGS